jgi:hypothetical protein
LGEFRLKSGFWPGRYDGHPAISACKPFASFRNCHDPAVSTLQAVSSGRDSGHQAIAPLQAMTTLVEFVRRAHAGQKMQEGLKASAACGRPISAAKTALNDL